MSAQTVLAPLLTVICSPIIAYFTARTARGTEREKVKLSSEIVTTEGRLAIEDKAYARASSYLEAALNDARREVDETRAELATERRERREEVDGLQLQMTRDRADRERAEADLRQRITAAEARADRAETAARALARRLGQPAPEL